MVGTTNFGRYYGRLLTPGLTNGSILKANLRAHVFSSANILDGLYRKIEEESIVCDRYCCPRKVDYINWTLTVDLKIIL